MYFLIITIFSGKVNGFVFLHGGIHQDFLDLNLSLEEANEQFRNSIGLSKKEVKSHDIYKVLHASTGPIWYRGFFKEGELDQKQIESLLKVPDTSTALGLRNRAIFELMYATGLRVTELISLSCVSCSFMDGVVRVLGKGKKERLVPLFFLQKSSFNLSQQDIH